MGESAAAFMARIRSQQQEEKRKARRTRSCVFDNAAFAAFLDQKLEERNIKQTVIAKDIGVERSTITNLKSSLRPSLDLYVRVCDYFELPYGVFIVSEGER